MSIQKKSKIAVIAGDGIGKEVIPAAITVIDAALAPEGVQLEWNDLDWGSDRYRQTGSMMPEDGLETLGNHDAIFLGAVGAEDIDDTVTLWGLLIPIRRAFEQYVNLRPVRSFEGVRNRLRDGEQVDMLIVRENNEGEYSEIGGRLFRGTDRELAVQESVFTRQGVKRITQFAAELAQARSKVLVSATKSNGIIHTMPFWDEVVTDTVTANYPDVSIDSVLIDALAARMVLDPAGIDVLVASNLFGDILSDLAAAVTGSIGIAPSANLNPERIHPSLFEPVHGSAPDIAGKGVANPIGAIWAGAMMLDHLGFSAAGERILRAITDTVSSGVTTRDLGGTASTAQFTSAMTNAVKDLA
ncbi:tartrate dehydrogenase [Microbacterium sp. A84]|uniref:tartrate dehydrogenase n=1 Tax=Microbacterium sp. A84 TaxID=3450715 RepID=UPI003F441067